MIDLKEILAKHAKITKEHPLQIAIENAMKEVWNTAVDECKKSARILYKEDGEITKIKSKKIDVEYLSESSSSVSIKIDEDSIEQVKQMI